MKMCYNKRNRKDEEGGSMKTTQYESEEAFLKAYDPNQFERLSLTTDILIFSVSSEKTNNYRKLSEKFLSVLLVKREDYPYKGKWCLPGGFVGIDESIEDATKRILKKETNLENIYVEQLYTFGEIDRDPRMRVISTAHVALIDKNLLKDNLAHNAKWFHVIPKEVSDGLEIVLDSGDEVLSFKVRKIVNDSMRSDYRYQTIENTSIAFDHDLVIASGLERIKNKIEYTDIAFHLVPEEFTLGELQQIYEVVLGKELLDPAFRRIIKEKVEKTNHFQTGEGHRPSALFRYKKNHQ